MSSTAPEMIRSASRLDKPGVDTVVAILEISQPGLSSTLARRVIEALVSAGVKMNAGGNGKEVESE